MSYDEQRKATLQHHEARGRNDAVMGIFRAPHDDCEWLDKEKEADNRAYFRGFDAQCKENLINA